jgi:hypothetical protein
VKLLFDENLSHHLVARLATLFPGAAHVRDVGLERADDQTIWAHARAHGHAIVSKDEDFAERALLEVAAVEGDLDPPRQQARPPRSRRSCGRTRMICWRSQPIRKRLCSYFRSASGAMARMTNGPQRAGFCMRA